MTEREPSTLTSFAWIRDRTLAGSGRPGSESALNEDLEFPQLRLPDDSHADFGASQGLVGLEAERWT